MSDELLRVADELYALPLGEFTGARDVRVRELKGTDLAPLVKQLRKPSLSAWVVNLVVRRDTEQLTQVLELGTALREAAAGMAGEELRALTRQRRQLTAAVTTGARSLAAAEGVRVTDAVAEQVEATLTAAMLDARCADAVRSGLLVTALSTTGVDEVDLTAAVAVPGALGFSATPVDAAAAPELHVVPDPDADEKAAAVARERVAEAQAALETARSEHARIASRVSDLEARSMQVQGEIAEARARLEELEVAAQEVEDELAEAEEERTEAESRLDEASVAHEKASESLERLRR